MPKLTLSQQGGFALLAFSVVMLTLALSVIMGFVFNISKESTLTIPARQAEYLADIKHRVSQWYLVNASQIDATESGGAFRDIPTVLREIGVSPKWGLEGAASDRQMAGSIAYTAYAFWIPTDNANLPQFDQTTGVFTQCPTLGARCPEHPFVLVSGFEAQSSHFKRTSLKLQAIADKLETFFKARFLFDPDRNISINRWLPVNGCTPLSDELPCLDTYTPLAGANLQVNTGIGSDEFINSWGGPIEVSNKQDSSYLEPPFSMTLRTTTPWGMTLQFKALQPM